MTDETIYDDDAPRNNGYLAIPDDDASIIARGNPRAINFNDRVQGAYFGVRNDPKRGDLFREMRQACTNDNAFEGHLADDDTESARLLRDHAREEIGDSVIAGAKLHQIRRAIGVVERRFHISRKERRAISSEPDFRTDAEGNTTAS
jgi:hypothetical protein